MATIKRTKDVGEIRIEKLKRFTATVCVVGTSALMMNRLNKKAREELLLPKRSMNKAARAASQKHNPPDEFNDSIYRCRDERAPTLLHVPAGAFKKAMASAALDMEGATKAEVGRLVQIIDETVHLYGVPYLDMSPVRLAGIVKTPDMRTRAKLPEWACRFTVRWVGNKIRQQDIMNLLDAAGDIVGIGDGRTEKGTFNFGSWRLCGEDDKQFQAIVKNQGRKVQEHAMANPQAVDADSEELLAWYYAEILRRRNDGEVAPPPGSSGTPLRAAPGMVTKPKRGNGRARMGAGA